MISKGRRITTALDVYGGNSTEDWQAVWGRIGRFGTAVEKLPPADGERQVSAFVTICEGSVC